MEERNINSLTELNLYKGAFTYSLPLAVASLQLDRVHNKNTMHLPGLTYSLPLAVASLQLDRVHNKSQYYIILYNLYNLPI